jgi:hypothetical protein
MIQKKYNTKINMRTQKRNLKIGVTIAVFLMFMVASVFNQDMSKLFRASILHVDEVPEFDGTVYPIQQVVDWLAVGGSYGNTKTFDQFSSDKVVSVPAYDAKTLSLDVASASGSSLSSLRLAKLVYTVVYLGTYSMDYVEGKGVHPAVDIVVPTGTPVYAIANGQVVKTDERTTGFGNHIVIGHPNVPDPDGGTTNLYSSYNHLNRILVDDEDIVKKGDLIGYTGNSGLSTAPHLHFQIDREIAPFFPYWPTGSTTAGQISNAKKYTVHPMDFVQENLNYDSTEQTHTSAPDIDTDEGEDDDDDDDTEEVITPEEPELADFELFYEDSTVETGSSFSIAVEAQDEDGKKITSFNEKAYGKIITDGKVENLDLSFKDGSQTFTAQAPSTPGNLTVVVYSGDIEIRESFTVENPTEYSYKLEFTDAFTRVGNDVRLNVYAQNGGRTDKNYKLETPLVLETEDGVEISDSTLSADDFEDGVATIYLKSDEIGKYNVKLLADAREFTSDLVSVIEDINPAAGFKIEHDGNFVVGQPEEITISYIDEDGDVTPDQSHVGDIVLNDTPGGGTFVPSTLSSRNFEYGVAKVQYTREDSEATVISVVQGLIRGNSKSLTAEEAKDLFSDVDQTHTNAKAIAYLKDHDIIGGYPDGTFQPDKTVSRVEALKMILLAFNISLTPTADLTFPDTDSEQWYAPYIGRALKLSVVKGYDDGSFKPAQTVNRAEFLKILFEATNTLVPEVNEVSNAPYPDVDPTAWFAGYAKFAESKNLVPTNADGGLEPSIGMTRADVAEVIYRLMAIEQTGASKYKETLSF